MRLAVLVALFPLAAMAQEQEALRPPQAQGDGAPVFDLVAADRETAWRINRQTGDIVVCRIDTTGSLETVRARCSSVAFEPGAQQSMTPPTMTPPPAAGGGRP